jgi:hypothetical protein
VSAGAGKPRAYRRSERVKRRNQGPGKSLACCATAIVELC